MPKIRSVNFSKSEEDKLVALVLEKKNILENKKTDAVTSKQKDKEWESLAEKFNSTSESSTVRTAKVLKEKYNNIKRMLRKNKANFRKEIFLTGGGPPPKEVEKRRNHSKTDELHELKKNILLQQFKHGRLEHKHRMDQNYEEHKMRMKILKLELKSKKLKK